MPYWLQQCPIDTEDALMFSVSSLNAAKGAFAALLTGINNDASTVHGYHVTWISTPVLVGGILSGLCALVASSISIALIRRHLQNYNNPYEQRYIVRICLMVPLMASTSWLSYWFYNQAVYFGVLRDMYEAFVIASFLILLMHYLFPRLVRDPETASVPISHGSLPHPASASSASPSVPCHRDLPQTLIVSPVSTSQSSLSFPIASSTTFQPPPADNESHQGYSTDRSDVHGNESVPLLLPSDLNHQDYRTIVQAQRAVMQQRKTSGIKQMLFPLCCFQFKPESLHFFDGVKTGVFQYVFVRPLTTLAAMIMQATNVYCQESLSASHGHFYIVILNTVSVSVAMYSLLSFYLVVHTDLQNHQPFSKFLCVKLVIFFSFWQNILLALLAQNNIITPTDYWSRDNMVTGIQSLLICVEMIIFAVLHTHGFSYLPYVKTDLNGEPVPTSEYEAVADSMDPKDIVLEILTSWSYISRQFGQLYRRQQERLRRSASGLSFPQFNIPSPRHMQPLLRQFSWKPMMVDPPVESPPSSGSSKPSDDDDADNSLLFIDDDQSQHDQIDVDVLAISPSAGDSAPIN